MNAYVYILQCADGTYYTGSTQDLLKRIIEHNSGEGATYTSKRLPVKVVYIEEFQRIEDAFKREKQIQPWSRAKKEALINNHKASLHYLASCKNESHFRNAPKNRKVYPPNND
jgi:putative endonuclease